ncbi:MAG: hypothetical protein Kow0089_03880 [Desulfobulbaceae bacterium]
MKRIFWIALFCTLLGHALAVQGAEDPQERFQPAGEGVVLDTRTGLMWATQDNGRDIDWYEAQTYCKEYEAGGFTDWRMPDIKELATLYAPESSNGDGYFISELFSLSECCLWSSYDTMGGALAFSFKSGKRPAAYLSDTYQMRVLPVRESGKEKGDDLDE